MFNDKRRQELKTRIDSMEKEIFHLTGNERAKARSEYYRFLHVYSKECGLEESIYLKRA